ncbi:MAG: MFS transporter [Chloroflexota bacterium]
MTESMLYRKKAAAWGIGGVAGFALLGLGQIVSLIGSGMTCFAQSIWVYTDMGGSITNLTVLSVLAQVPGLAISLFAGVLVDRWDRRWIMIVCNGVAALATLWLRSLVMADNFQIWHMYVVIVILSIVNHFQWPAFFATIPLVVSKQNLGSANGVVQLARSFSQTAAPFIAGVVVTLFSIQGVILFDMASYIFALATLLMVRIPNPPRRAPLAKLDRQAFLRELKEGWRYIVDRSGLSSLVVYSSASNFLVGITGILMMPMALAVVSAKTYGALISISGISMMLGSLVMTFWGGPKRRMYGVLFFMLLQCLAMMLGGFRPSIELYLVASTVFYLAVPISSSCVAVIWQSKVSLDLQGRVFAVAGLFSTAAFQLGVLVSGPLADHVFEPLLMPGGALAGSVGRLIGVGAGRGIGLIFILLGAMGVAITLVGLFYPRLRRLDTEVPDAIDAAEIVPAQKRKPAMHTTFFTEG